MFTGDACHGMECEFLYYLAEQGHMFSCNQTGVQKIVSEYACEFMISKNGPNNPSWIYHTSCLL